MATPLDQLDAVGVLDGANSIGNMEYLDNVTIHNATGSASVSASASALEPIKLKSASGVGVTSALASASADRIRQFDAVIATAGSVSASAILIRLVGGQPTANVSATASITPVRQVTATATAAATTNQPTANFVLNFSGSGSVTAAATASQPTGTFSMTGSAGITTAASAIASGKILGEDWAVVQNNINQQWAVQ